MPVGEEPSGPMPTVVADHYDTDTFVSPFDCVVADGRSLPSSKVHAAWEDAYATGSNCIWVVPWADQDVRRVLAEGWFQSKGICLELGCGLGYDSIAFAEAGFDVTGVDISQTAIGVARE